MQPVAVDVARRDHAHGDALGAREHRAVEILALGSEHCFESFRYVERPHAVVLQARVVEEHARDDERPRERAAPGLVGAGDEPCAEPAVELQEALPGLHPRPSVANGSAGDYSPAGAVAGSAPRGSLASAAGSAAFGRPPASAGCACSGWASSRRRGPVSSVSTGVRRPRGPRGRRPSRARSASRGRAPSCRRGREGSRASRGSRRRPPAPRSSRSSASGAGTCARPRRRTTACGR